MKIAYYTSTGLLSIMMVLSASMYLFNHEEIVAVFNTLGFPSYIIYPLAIAKLLGLVAVWTRKSEILLEWAYAAFFFNFILAISAHLNNGDGDQMGGIIATVLLFMSYFSGKKYFSESAK